MPPAMSCQARRKNEEKPIDNETIRIMQNHANDDEKPKNWTSNTEAWHQEEGVTGVRLKR